MWESPIELQFGINDMVEFIKGQTEQTEKYIVESVQSVGIKINKEELIKAINYDRNQYEKGYKNGYMEGYSDAQDDWVYNENPENNGRYLAAVQCGKDKGIVIGKYIDGRWMLFENEMLIAWQPLPEVPEVR